MKIWRIQNEAGLGPYLSAASACGNLHDRNQHPDPYHDIPAFKLDNHTKSRQRKPLSAYRFGFADIQSLRSWFDDRSLVSLYKEGLRVVCVSVPKRNVRFGKKQVAFRADKAWIVQTLDNINLNSNTLV